jgi:hypothetical protein
MRKGSKIAHSKADLRRLKDFQRKTVSYVFRRLYKDPDAVDRFLIADEVGLGKTLVARGIIMKAIEFLKESVDRIDIVYICSNSSIARQNVNRLNVTGSSDSAIAERMTLLPLHMEKLSDNRVNFVSFTPGTSFDLRSSGGTAKERALIYHMLKKGWNLGDQAGPRNLLQGDVYYRNWRRRIRDFPFDEIDKTLSEKFLKILKDRGIRRRFNWIANKFPRAKRYKNIPHELRQERTQMIGELRTLLAKSCISALEPDIVILDEFQRFRNLLDGDDEVGQLARAVFEYPSVKVILLSATPYKMYTMYHERENDDHYKDFLRTIGFLFDTDEKTDHFEEDLARYRDTILDPKGISRLDQMKIKSRIEHRLRKVMVRTERLSVFPEQRRIMSDIEIESGLLETNDLKSFSMLDQVAHRLNTGDTIEYWKSAPYLLNIMERDGYRIKKELVDHFETSSDETLKEKFLGHDQYMLTWDQIRLYQQVEPANARLRKLFSNTVDRNVWKLLWIAPSLPYYIPQKGPYADSTLNEFTKALIFSTWMVVPKAIAMLTSYEAERRMVINFDSEADYQNERNRPRLLDFKSTRGRLAGMSVFSITYPCLTLAMKFDPLQAALKAAETGGPLDVTDINAEAEIFLKDLLAPILERFHSKEGRYDERWYWAALAALDWKFYRAPVREWLNTTNGDFSWTSMVGGDEEGESRFDEHVNLFKEHFQTSRSLGRPPSDLISVLAKVVLASPAVVALRSMLRFCKLHEIKRSGEWLLSSAARVAMGFRYLFNLPESMALVRSLSPSDDSRYWESVLDYCVDGNLQSVMDEYVHILQESLGLIDRESQDAVPQIAKEIQSAVSLRTVNLEFDEIFHNKLEGRMVLEKHSIRCRFALKFGDARSEDEKTEIRKDQVRRAFNSPFRPFVLATTSIGQEGLDFHQFCHDIYHWNLPANPVDFEQREGRIHRYKGHMIRRNIAKVFPLRALKQFDLKLKDPWVIMFKQAHQKRAKGSNDLVPYWIYDIEGGHGIKRYIPTFPLSRDRENLDNLRKSLVAYRIVMGQPRQEDLVNFLQQRFEEGVDADKFLEYRIDLSPK